MKFRLIVYGKGYKEICNNTYDFEDIERFRIFAYGVISGIECFRNNIKTNLYVCKDDGEYLLCF